MPTPDYGALMDAAIAASMRDPKWIDARYEGIKIVTNTHVGRVGQTFVEALCNELDLPFKVPTDNKGKRLNTSSWDIEILGVQFELKTATQDVNGCFQFNHIRYHRDYDAALLLGVSPEEILFACHSKASILTRKTRKPVSMEKGANASYKFTQRPSELFPICDFESRVRAIALSLRP
jgi:hypothetical protein